MRVPTRDGTRLATDIRLPHDLGPGGCPAVLIRTPYNKQWPQYVEPAEKLVAHGYAVAIQDVRGRNDSEGEWWPFVNEGPDGYDAIEWLAAQPWCDGRVGMLGGSYAGWVQWAAARERPPSLKTMISTASAGHWLRELPSFNGMVCLWMLGWLNLVSGRTLQDNSLVDWWPVLRHRPLRELSDLLGRELPAWQEWLDHLPDDGYWNALTFGPEDFARIELPVLHITGWYDGDQPGALFMYQGMADHSPRGADQRLLIGPWDHAGTRSPKPELGGVEFGLDAVLDLNDLYVRWFGHYLKGGASDLPPVRLFVTGPNRWSDLQSWPPRSQPMTLHLSSGGRANGLLGDGRLGEEAQGASFDEYTFDPERPVQSSMDLNHYAPKLETPLDVRFIERRDDVLVYTSDACTEPLQVVGIPNLILYASSDAPDTDWVVTLTDVHPDGRSIRLARGRLRARFRGGLDREVLLDPGLVYRFEIELGVVGHTFLPGHRVRLSVTSSDFPDYDVNPNTGEPIADATAVRIARNGVHHSAGHPPALTLPVSAEATASASTESTEMAAITRAAPAAF